MSGTLRVPRLLGAALVLGALLLSATAFGSRPAAAFANCDVSDLAIDQEERSFLQIINNHRAQYGLSALTISENLNRSATWMATDMARKNYFSHGDSIGRLSQTRIADCGGSMVSGENLGAGPQIISAAQAFDLWRTSPAHNANMLYGSYRQIGIARVLYPGSYYTYYWVTTFDVRDDGTGGSSGPAPTLSGAKLIDPAPGSTLSGRAAAFHWTNQPGAYEYWLDVGSCFNCNDIYAESSGQALAAIVMDLPIDGRPIYVRLSVRTARGWEYEDYTYWAASLQ